MYKWIGRYGARKECNNNRTIGNINTETRAIHQRIVALDVSFEKAH
jgi:hypothetical protein